MKKYLKGFTLAEVLITLAIIGVVAALTIPGVIVNTQQQEFKTGLKKAVSVLNSAITMNIALDSETPMTDPNLFEYLQKHMAVMSVTDNLAARASRENLYGSAFASGVHIDENEDTPISLDDDDDGGRTPQGDRLGDDDESGSTIITDPPGGGGSGSDPAISNAAFYTTDGMRFEFSKVNTDNKLTLHEDHTITLCSGSTAGGVGSCGGCGSYGLAENPNKTTTPPCVITVDVNGDKKPSTPGKPYKIADPSGNKVSDIFSIMITERKAIPYGTVAQKAMYQAQR